MQQYEYDIDPQTHRWPLRRRVGFGLLAWLPTAFLAMALGLGVAHLVASNDRLVTDAAAILLYTHVVAQVIVVLVFGHVLMNHEHLSTHAKVWWGAWFLLAAPVAVPAYWILHVMAEDPGAAHRPGRVRVVDICYADDEHPERELREDGVVVEHRRSDPDSLGVPWSAA